MSGYTPLFNSIVLSSIWQENNETRIVWITLLALSDAKGIVECSILGLANAAKVSIQECEKAVHVLKSPDKYSRNQSNEGKRIEEIDGGYRILNYIAYREKAKIKTAEWWRNYRKNKDIATNCNVANSKVQQNATTETETETETETKKHIQENRKTLFFKPPSLEEVQIYCKEIDFQLDEQHFIDFYESKGWYIGKNKMKNWKAAVRTWKKRTPQPQKEETSTERTERLRKEGIEI